MFYRGEMFCPQTDQPPPPLHLFVIGQFMMRKLLIIKSVKHN